ncbi:hypothetical protein SCYAM73S_03901 [Streptomyces cyaneofuscatus]
MPQLAYWREQLADLPEGTRYLNSVIMPDDTVFTTGGSEDYRGRSASNILKSQTYDPKTNTFKEAAEPTVGRNYHSEALLLPDGRVATFGSDSLYDDKDNTKLGKFEQRMEVYTPHRPAPRQGQAPGDRERPRERGARHDGHLRERRRGPDRHRPADAPERRHSHHRRGAALHRAGAEKAGGKLSVTVPDDPTLVPPGWYMLFVTDTDGIPSEAKWVKVG